jgi:hypothetical protein
LAVLTRKRRGKSLMETILELRNIKENP